MVKERKNPMDIASALCAAENLVDRLKTLNFDAPIHDELDKLESLAWDIAHSLDEYAEKPWVFHATEDLACRLIDIEEKNEVYQELVQEAEQIVSHLVEAHLEELGYVKTDDYQFQKKIDDGVYRMADVMEMPDGNYRVFGGKVDLSEYSQEHIEAIVLSYYDSMNTLCEAYPDEEVRKGIIAECIFETEYVPDEYEGEGTIPEGQVFEAICRYADSCEEMNMNLDEKIAGAKGKQVEQFQSASLKNKVLEEAREKLKESQKHLLKLMKTDSYAKHEGEILAAQKQVDRDLAAVKQLEAKSCAVDRER